MKKIVLIMCLVAVSGFASYCSSDLTSLNNAIEKYNRDCTGSGFNVRLNNQKSSATGKSKCDELKEKIDKYRYELELCRERRNDDIANKFKYYR